MKLVMKQTIYPAILLILLIVSTQMAYAHGGAHFAYLSHQQVGSYTLDIWGDSEKPQAGKVYLDGIVLNSSTGVPAQECDLFFQATNLEDGTLLAPVKAQSPTVETGYRYLGVLDLDSPGTYQITATVMGSDGQAGSVTFTVNVYREYTWFKWIINGLLLCYSLAGLWLLKEGFRVWGIKTWQAENAVR